jgi:hypothetical protein
MRQSSDLIAQPERCINIGDREADIYEIFAEAADLNTRFLVRKCSDRLVGDGNHTISDEMAELRVQGLHRVELRDARGKNCEALLKIRYRRVTVLDLNLLHPQLAHFLVTMLNRADPTIGPSDAFTDTEVAVLDRLSPKTAVPELVPRTLAHYTTQLAKLGGYLARKGDPPPGNIVMWRGLTRLTDIVLGMKLAVEVVGN